MNSLLEVYKLSKYFPVRSGLLKKRTGYVYAVDQISFSLEEGETLGLVGESGCGKSTAIRTILNLITPYAGKVIYNGRNIFELPFKELQKIRQDIQIIFQDPFGSLNPRMTVAAIIEEPLRTHRVGDRRSRREKIAKTLETVGLLPEHMKRFPHEFSGGQRQRIGIARAISLEPEIIICDEPVSALDVSVQSKILNLLLKLQQKMDLTYVFISHDLSVVKHVSDRIAVMYLGKIVELANADAIYNNGRHPYTKALLSSIPRPDPASARHRIILKGEVPSAENPPFGCRFNTRCEQAQNICREKEPELLKNKDDSNHSNHFTACHFSYACE